MLMVKGINLVVHRAVLYIADGGDYDDDCSGANLRKGPRKGVCSTAV